MQKQSPFAPQATRTPRPQREAESSKGKRGIVLTFDMAIALLLLFTIMLLASAYYSRTSQNSFQSSSLRSTMYDASSVMSELGYLYAPLDSPTAADTSGIREVLRSLPPSVCMEVSVYDTPFDEGLIGYWNFDEGTGTIAHDLAGGHDGTVTRAAWDADARAGTSLFFNGNQYSVEQVTTNNAVIWDRDFSIAVWVKPSGLQAALAPIVAGNPFDSRFILGADATGAKYHLRINNSLGSAVEGGNLTSGKWQLVVGTFNGSIAKLYVDGVPVSNRSTNSTLRFPVTIYMGAAPALVGGYNFYHGNIDEVRLYDRVLSPGEIARMYSDPTNKLYTVNSENCKYSGGQLQSMSFPFSHNANTGKPKFYIAVIRSWYKGA